MATLLDEGGVRPVPLRDALSERSLAYVSPASGRAVSRSGSGGYADRLLTLPAFLLGRAPADAAQLAAGLRLTGAFLRRHLFDASDRAMPEARDRLLARVARSTEP